jgi:hypothetical protein
LKMGRSTKEAETRIAFIPENKRYLTRVLDSLDNAFADFDSELAILDLPHIKALLDVKSSFSKLQSEDAFRTLTSKQKAEYRAILRRFHEFIAEIALDTAEQQIS